jgi:hypothetical protein
MRVEGGSVTNSKANAPSANPSKEEKAAAAAERKRQRAGELRQRRLAKLQAVEPVVQEAEKALQLVRERIRRRNALADHLQAFYAEVDKLAKGNRQLEATDLAVEQANAIIRDAKEMVSGDFYLERVKEFVPAGENPVYPDVLMVAATVQAAVRRAEAALAGEETRLHERWQNARTIAAAARLILDGSEQPLKAEVADALGDKPAGWWFYKDDDGRSYFDVGRFDDTDAELLMRPPRPE